MTPEREQEIRKVAALATSYPGDPFHAAESIRDLLAALDAERVRCADLERERDEALVRAREAEWARNEWKADAKHLERERDGWKARAEQAEAQLRHARDYCARPAGVCFDVAAARPGSGAPAECPHCHVELVDGTCVAGCYYRVPETQEDTP